MPINIHALMQYSDNLKAIFVYLKKHQMFLYNEVIGSITKDGQELMPPEDQSIQIGYDDPRTYLPQELIDYLDGYFYG